MQMSRICALKAGVLFVAPRVFSTVATLFDNHDFRMAHRSLYPDSPEGTIDNVNEKTTSSSVKANVQQTTKTPFGTRYLTDPEKVFEHNAWDHMMWTEEQIDAAKKKIEENSQTQVETEKQELFETEADRFWDEFYSKHQNRFFKDRHWLFKEFPELSTQEVMEEKSSSTEETNAASHTDGSKNNVECHQKIPKNTCPLERGLENVTTVMDGDVDPHLSNRLDQEKCGNDSQAGSEAGNFPGSRCKRRFLEVGCGVGNTVFPILQTNNDPDLFVYCCDFSSVAIDLVKTHPDYNPSRCHGFVYDITDTDAAVPFPENSLDIIILIFVLSALHPDKMQSAVNRFARFLKPGGLLLFRDYGKYDLAQLRFKPGRCLSDNFYVRGDGTRVYFFTQDELKNMFTAAGLVEEQNVMDRRLQVNRGRQITMYRVWIQCKYRKPLTTGK